MQISKIIIGIDNSEIAEYAAAYGFDLARTFNAHVGLVHIIEPNILPVGASVDPMLGNSMTDMGAGDMELMDIQANSSEKLIDKITTKYGADLRITQFSDFGDTADGIIACCNEFAADMIVIGTHARTGIDRFLMGSIAEHVIRHAQVPVLVVPMPKNDD